VSNLSPVTHERAFLGSMMAETSFLGETILSPDDFSIPAHKYIFETMQSLYKLGKDASLIGLLDAIPRTSEERDLVCEIATDVYAASNWQLYEKAIREAKILRQLSDAAEQILPILQTKASIDDKIDEIQRMFSVGNASEKSTQTSKELVVGLIEYMEKASGSKGGMLGVATGFRGLREGDLVVVAGRPSMGKTTFALNIGLNAAIAGKKVMVFTLEMSSQQVMQKLLAARCHIPVSRVIDGSAFDFYGQKVSAALNELAEANLLIDETPAISIQQLSSKARRARPDMIVVDYIGLMSGGGGNNRVEEMGRISSGLKSLARELGIPVIALSQLNRGVEHREDKRPMMSDLRDSGSVEQDADIIMMLYREDYYDPLSPAQGYVEVLTRKHRMGEVGTDFLLFASNESRFADAQDKPQKVWEQKTKEARHMPF
jgi:replicative DNA helicase